MQMTLAFAPDQADLADVWFDLSSGVLTYAHPDAFLMADETEPEGEDAAEDEDGEDDDEDDEDDDDDDDEDDEDDEDDDEDDDESAEGTDSDTADADGTPAA